MKERIPVLRETRDNETRVSITPFEVKTLAQLGCKIFVQKNAGKNSGYSDIDYEINGAEIIDDSSNSFYQNIDIVLQVKRPSRNVEAEIVNNLPFHSLIVGFLNPLISNKNHIQLYQKKK